VSLAVVLPGKFCDSASPTSHAEDVLRRQRKHLAEASSDASDVNSQPIVSTASASSKEITTTTRHEYRLFNRLFNCTVITNTKLSNIFTHSRFIVQKFSGRSRKWVWGGHMASA